MGRNLELPRCRLVVLTLSGNLHFSGGCGSLRAYSSRRSSSSSVPVQTDPFMSPSRPRPADASSFHRRHSSVQANICRLSEHATVNPPAGSEVTPSAKRSHSVRPTEPRLLSSSGDVGFLMREVRAACYVLNLRAPKTVSDLTKISFLWFHELLGQELELDGYLAVPKQAEGQGFELEDENEEEVVYENPRMDRWSTLKQKKLF